MVACGPSLEGPEVPKGRHNVAHRLNGGERSAIIKSPVGAGGTIAWPCTAPRELNFHDELLPTVHTVGYALSSLTGLATM
jgi:hypothetical protein